ncbi:unnamed protein product [Parnassius apollo]|uniref:(apollo) hypothetical protein n=1 Tax=Parnassius apollo TaxID=110799 RepID=A0A8S3YAQ6_PARAO|nr:unnamed protein product [Parnassius apollo]
MSKVLNSSGLSQSEKLKCSSFRSKVQPIVSLCPSDIVYASIAVAIPGGVVAIATVSAGETFHERLPA